MNYDNITRHLLDNPGHQLVIETVHHTPVSWAANPFDNTEWVATIRDTLDNELHAWSGLTPENALSDLDNNMATT